MENVCRILRWLRRKIRQHYHTEMAVENYLRHSAISRYIILFLNKFDNRNPALFKLLGCTLLVRYKQCYCVFINEWDRTAMVCDLNWRRFPSYSVLYARLPLLHRISLLWKVAWLQLGRSIPVPAFSLLLPLAVVWCAIT